MDWEMLIPILGIIFGVPFGCGIPLLAIWTEHKKNMALIEKGLYQPKPRPVSPGRAVLMWGLILACAGIALAISSIWMVAGGLRAVGIVAASIGIALLIFFVITREKKPIPQ